MTMTVNNEAVKGMKAALPKGLARRVRKGQSSCVREGSTLFQSQPAPLVWIGSEAAKGSTCEYCPLPQGSPDRGPTIPSRLTLLDIVKY